MNRKEIREFFGMVAGWTLVFSLLIGWLIYALPGAL